MDNALELHQVTKRFGDHVAVDHLDLTVPTGSIYGFIGPNGSGKTTTLRIILRILYPDDGHVVVLGKSDHRAAHDAIGYLPEERGLYQKMKVRELLRFYAELKGLRRCAPAIDEWLDRLELADWADRKVEALSKGMAQKIQFIATVISRPKLVILDEPFSGLDPVNMEVLKDAVLQLRDEGATVIFSTHDMDMAERMCDTIFMIFRGRKVLDGTLSEIQSQYGADTIRLRMSGGRVALDSLPGVQHVNDYGTYRELRLAPSADSNAILARLMPLGRIERFELARPSLHDIFVRIAGPESDTMREHHHA